MATLTAPATRTKTEAAFVALRDAIEDGRLRPGERLVLSRLIAELGMSPTPIREALRLLQAQGLAAYSAHHGMVVAEYAPDDVAEVSRIRVELEPLAVALAVERADEDDLAEMRAAHEALKAAHEGRTPESEAATLNAAWHAAVYRPAASPLLTDFIARLWAGVPVEAVWRRNRAGRSLREHDAIMEAIERRDAETARRLMREHIERGSAATIAHMRSGKAS
ncbi:MAG TPA: GntR family transcriptional regulator [Solirubrobacteraceae bacterium]|nr:GntR family transcriptional regulator [Solirubrobacteraceae bacterium]